jgi:hypothetical protein
MKAYNETWVENLNLKPKLIEYFQNSLLDATEYRNGENELREGFYRPNWWIKVGLFVFTLIAISFSSATLSLIFSIIDNETALNIYLIISGIICVCLLEYLIKIKKLYGSGVDNAFIYSAIGFFASTLILHTPNASYFIPLILLIILVPFFIRYSDLLVAFAIFVNFYLFVFLLSLEYSMGKTLLPFIFLILSGSSYFLIKKYLKSIYYYKTKVLFEILSMLVFYLSGNYYIVREGNALINDLNNGSEIPFGAVFWVLTFVIPGFFIFKAINDKDKKILQMGFLTSALSVLTFWYYYIDIQLEWNLTLAGMALIGCSVLGLRLFKNTKANINIKPEVKFRTQKMEAIFMSGLDQLSQSNSGNVQFGGGDFGGGGAQGEV